jgi:hypothetical protein
MNENLNLVELLKDCPKGTKLYSPALGECTLEKFFKDKTFSIQVKYKTKDNTFSELFTKEGYLFSEISDAECMLFPSRDQRDWSKWQRPFVKGDVLVSKAGNIVLFSHISENQVVHYLCLLRPHGTLKISNDVGVGYSYECTLANDFQKQKLFDALKANGYKWNPETKTLEKLKKEKFDPKTLQPFDKVLVRQYNVSAWCTDFYSYYDEVNGYAVCTGDVHYDYCIPYNNDTKHLVSKTEDAPEFYRYWEE